MGNTDKLLSLQDKYQEILLEDGGLRTLCDTLTEEIGSPVFILDKYHENLLYIDRELREGKFDFYSYLEERQAVKKETISPACRCNSTLDKITYNWKEGDHVEVQAKLGRKEEVLGILCILFSEDEIKEEECIAITQAVYALSIKLHQNNLVQNLARKCSNELIEELLQGRIKEKKEMVKRGELAGWDLTVSYQLFILRFKTAKEEKDEERSLYTYELEEKIINSLHRIIRTNISRKYIIFSYAGDILLLIHYPEEEEAIKEDSQKIYHQLSNKFSDHDILIGAGDFVEDCSQIPESYQQGLHTLEFLETTNQRKRVFFYEDLSILRLLWQIDRTELEEFACEYLEELFEYDRSNNADWLETLGTYLKEGGSLQGAAKKLHIHPNTMRYRINRIQEILETDLKEFETQLNLAIAYKIYKFILSEDDKGV